MQSYFWKKEEFQKTSEKAKSRQLQATYESCLKLTEECFAIYAEFYNVMRALLDDLIHFYNEIDESSKQEIDAAIVRYKNAKELYEKEGNCKSKLLSQIFDSSENLEILINASVNQAHAANEQRQIARSISDYQAKLLSVILEEVFEVLFLTIFRMDQSSPTKDAAREFLNFTIGFIPIIGPFASGLIAIVNTITSRRSRCNSADEVLFYLETYGEVCSVWTSLTKGYIDMLKEWRVSLKQNEYKKAN